MGASRVRLIRQFVNEGLMIAVFGGAAGVFLGSALLRIVTALLPATFPAVHTVRMIRMCLASPRRWRWGSVLLFGHRSRGRGLARRSAAGVTREQSRFDARTPLPPLSRRPDHRRDGSGHCAARRSRATDQEFLAFATPGFRLRSQRLLTFELPWMTRSIPTGEGAPVHQSSNRTSPASPGRVT